MVVWPDVTFEVDIELVGLIVRVVLVDRSGQLHSGQIDPEVCDSPQDGANSPTGIPTVTPPSM